MDKFHYLSVRLSFSGREYFWEKLSKFDQQYINI